MPKPNYGVENGISTVGAVLWTVQIIPQIVKSYRSKSTLGLSASLMALWAFSSYPFSAYIVAQRLAIPLQIQPHAFGFLCAVSWMQCLYYGHGKSKIRTILYFLAFIIVWAGFETGSIYALWAAEDRGISAPSKVYGYLSAAMLAGALLPQYWEIYKLKQVVGISLIFMAIDILGGVFSLLSLFFRAEIDVAACVSYGLVVVLDGVVVILAFILNPIARRRQAKEQAMESVPRFDAIATTSVAPIAPGAPGSDKPHERHELPTRVKSRDSIMDGAPQRFRWPEDDPPEARLASG